MLEACLSGVFSILINKVLVKFSFRRVMVLLEERQSGGGMNAFTHWWPENLSIVLNGGLGKVK